MKIAPLHWAVLFGAVIWTLSPSTARCGTAEYDSLALRLHYGYFKAKLVAGKNGTETLKISSKETAELFRQRSPEAVTFYEKYRSTQRKAGRFGWLTLGFSIGAIVAYSQDTHSGDNLGTGLLLGSLASLMTASAISTHAQDYLSQAVWTYNATLADP
jgi:hypothetical protein